MIRQIGTAPNPPAASPRKVTFAGGEPLLSITVLEDIAHAKRAGLVTSLVTNGSLLTEEKLRHLAPVLDWLTISIDSLNPEPTSASVAPPKGNRCGQKIILNESSVRPRSASE